MEVEVNVLNKLFEALSHPVRRDILRLLRQRGELPAGEVSDAFELTKPTMSHHLKLLAEAGLVDRERRGSFIYYRIQESVAEEALAAILELLGVSHPQDPP